MLIYKIFRTPEWEEMQEMGQTLGAPIDITDGYVHFSTAQQARETAAKHFAGETGLFLIAADTTKMPALKWEISRGGAEFPHLYAPFEMAQVAWSEPLPLVDGVHQFPAAMT